MSKRTYGIITVVSALWFVLSFIAALFLCLILDRDVGLNVVAMSFFPYLAHTSICDKYPDVFPGVIILQIISGPIAVGGSLYSSTSLETMLSIGPVIFLTVIAIMLADDENRQAVIQRWYSQIANELQTSTENFSFYRPITN